MVLKIEKLKEKIIVSNNFGGKLIFDIINKKIHLKNIILLKFLDFELNFDEVKYFKLEKKFVLYRGESCFLSICTKDEKQYPIFQEFYKVNFIEIINLTTSLGFDSKEAISKTLFEIKFDDLKNKRNDIIILISLFTILILYLIWIYIFF